MGRVVVQLNDGLLNGTTRTIVNGDAVLAFLGIPYAKAPVGELRFKAPVPVEPWVGVKDATQDGHPCFGTDLIMGPNLNPSENCLFLNVFTKSLQPDNMKPVMVFIHGGKFTACSSDSNIYNPDFLLTEDVVLVTMNYRIGLFGFLRLNDPELEVFGNAALKDQRLALQWVQKNIQNFGGDPNNVTLFGCSAGAVCAHYHLWSRSTKGLFHKVILQSGCIQNPWAFGGMDLIDMLKTVGKSIKTEAEAFEYLKSLTGEEIFNLQEDILKAAGAMLSIIGPVIEVPNSTAFITDELQSKLYNEVPLILGYCEKEALLFEAAKLLLKKETAIESDDTSLENLLSDMFQMKQSDEHFKEIVREILDYYATEDDTSDIQQRIISDFLFVYGIVTATRLHIRMYSIYTPVYLYRFSLDAGLNALKNMAKLKMPGACHGDDLGYLFNFSSAPETGSEEEMLWKRSVKLWTNFAKTSNPTPSGSNMGIPWIPVGRDDINFLDIGKTLSVGYHRGFQSIQWMKMWKKITDIVIGDKFVHF